MIETANKWLKDNLDYELINCETIKILFKYNDSQNYYDLRFNDISHYIYGTEKNNLLKALRIWIKRKEITSTATTNEDTEKDVNDTTNTNANTSNIDAGYATDSLSSDTPQQQQESPKLSNLTEILKRRWTQPQHQFQKATATSSNKNTTPTKLQNQTNQKHMNEIHSTEHSPKKNAFQQQQAFRLQQFSSQSKFYLNKLQRQASCPQSNNAFQITHNNAPLTTNSAQNSPIYTVKQQQMHNQQANQQSNQLTNQQQQHQQQINQSQQQQQSANQSQQSKTKCNNNSIILNYIDIIPELSEENEKFERLDECLNKLNRLIKDGQIKGRILNVETSSCEATVKWRIDTENSFTAMTTKNVYFLRCFYIENDKLFEMNERIRIMDFIPENLLINAGFFKRPKYESFSLLIPKATEWLVNNSEFKFKNAQTLDVKIKCKLIISFC